MNTVLEIHRQNDLHMFKNMKKKTTQYMNPSIYCHDLWAVYKMNKRLVEEDKNKKIY